MATFAGHIGDVYVASQTGVAFSNVAMTNAGDDKDFTISDTTKRFWDDTAAVPVIETSPDGVVWSPAAGYTVQNCGGKVVFTAAQTGLQVRASGTYLPITHALNGYEWELDVDTTLQDVSVFGDQWKAQAPTTREATVKFSRYWVDQFFIGQLGNKLVMILYADFSGNTRYECFAWMKSDSIKVAEKDIDGEELNFDADGAVFAYLA